MSRNFAGSPQTIIGTVGSFAVPLTLAAWCKPTNLLSTQGILTLGTSASTPSHRISLITGLARVTSYSGSEASVNTTTATAGAWNHVAGVFNAANSRSIFINGGGKQTNTTNLAPTFNRITIGCTIFNTNLDFFTGEIAECAVWNTALTDDEVASLARGYSPQLIHPQNLLYYVPLVNEIIEIKGLSLVNTSTTAGTTHSRIILP